MRRLSLPVLALVSTTLGAWSDDGWEARAAARCGFKLGVTTRAEVTAAMGRPTAEAPTPSGVVMVSYRRFAGPGGPKNPMIGLAYGADGKLMYVGSNEAVAPCPPPPGSAKP
jgi:hypothetical protein